MNDRWRTRVEAVTDDRGLIEIRATRGGDCALSPRAARLSRSCCQRSVPEPLPACIPLDIYRRAVYFPGVIKTFRDKDTAALYGGKCPARFRAFRSVAERRLQALDAATQLGDLRAPPGNRLEKLSGDREGQWNIRINDQWRICFRWTDAPEDVEIVDYH